jgi:hypothetical protein
MSVNALEDERKYAMVAAEIRRRSMWICSG